MTPRPEVLSAPRVVTPGGVLAGGAVTVEGDRITWVGPLAALPSRFEEVPHTAYDDATITPGLIDAHVHLGFDGGADPVARMRSETDEQQRLLMRASARDLLHAGVTTARDLGARNFLDVETRDAVRTGEIDGPRLLVAGRPITPRGGHCWFMGGGADTVEDVVDMVRLHHARGVDVIKVMVTGGFMTAGTSPWEPQYPPAVLRAIVEQATELGLPVAAHAHGAEGIRAALDAGVGTIEHLSWPGGPDAPPFDRDLAQRLVDSGVPCVPTMNRECHDASVGLGFTIGEHLLRLHGLGVRLVAGTDAGIDLAPHGAYVGGLEYWAELGFTPAQVVEFSTAAAADALGLGGVTGRLAPGLAADLLVVDGDPMADLGAFRGLRRIVTAGRTVPSASPG